MRVAADTVQLALPDLGPARPAERWWSLPESTRSEVLTLLAGLIARGVLIDTETATDTATDERGSDE
jgi:hypothetical protein